jgi:hypothetical protein
MGTHVTDVPGLRLVHRLHRSRPMTIPERWWYPAVALAGGVFLLGAIGCTSSVAAAVDGGADVRVDGGADVRVDGGADIRGFDSLGAGYPCTAGQSSSTCVVGSSYCRVNMGGAAGQGGGPTPYETAGCAQYPAGSACASLPTCACLCPEVGLCQSCTCTDVDGRVTIVCRSA